jgi:hypothetical protein
LSGVGGTVTSFRFSSHVYFPFTVTVISMIA